MKAGSLPWLGVLAFVSACSSPALKTKGARCHSLSECKAGLACVDFRCTSNLDDLAGASRPPPGLPAEGEMPEGSQDAATPPADSSDAN